MKLGLQERAVTLVSFPHALKLRFILTVHSFRATHNNVILFKFFGTCKSLLSFTITAMAHFSGLRDLIAMHRYDVVSVYIILHRM